MVMGKCDGKALREGAMRKQSIDSQKLGTGQANDQIPLRVAQWIALFVVGLQRTPTDAFTVAALIWRFLCITGTSFVSKTNKYTLQIDFLQSQQI